MRRRAVFVVERHQLVQHIAAVQMAGMMVHRRPLTIWKMVRVARFATRTRMSRGSTPRCFHSSDLPRKWALELIRLSAMVIQAARNRALRNVPADRRHDRPRRFDTGRETSPHGR